MILISAYLFCTMIVVAVHYYVYKEMMYMFNNLRQRLENMLNEQKERIVSINDNNHESMCASISNDISDVINKIDSINALLENNKDELYYKIDTLIRDGNNSVINQLEIINDKTINTNSGTTDATEDDSIEVSINKRKESRKMSLFRKSSKKKSDNSYISLLK